MGFGNFLFFFPFVSFRKFFCKDVFGRYLSKKTCLEVVSLDDEVACDATVISLYHVLPSEVRLLQV